MKTETLKSWNVEKLQGQNSIDKFITLNLQR